MKPGHERMLDLLFGKIGDRLVFSCLAKEAKRCDQKAHLPAHLSEDILIGHRFPTRPFGTEKSGIYFDVRLVLYDACLMWIGTKSGDGLLTGGILTRTLLRRNDWWSQTEVLTIQVYVAEMGISRSSV